MVTLEYLDVDGLCNIERRVPKAEANVLRLYLGSNPNPAVDISLSVVSETQVNRIIQALKE